MYGTSRETKLSQHERNMIGVGMAYATKSVEEIAADFNVSTRTVIRIGADALKDPAGAADRAALENEYRSQVYRIVTEKKEREALLRERMGFVHPRSRQTEERWYPEEGPGRERVRRARPRPAPDSS